MSVKEVFKKFWEAGTRSQSAANSGLVGQEQSGGISTTGLLGQEPKNGISHSGLVGMEPQQGKQEDDEEDK